jgi:hypothetical protein
MTGVEVALDGQGVGARHVPGKVCSDAAEQGRPDRREAFAAVE